MTHASRWNCVSGMWSRSWLAVLVPVLGLGAPLAALADQGDITYSNQNWFDQIQYYSPLGQSFTAQAGALHGLVGLQAFLDERLVALDRLHVPLERAQHECVRGLASALGELVDPRFERARNLQACGRGRHR